MRPPRLRKDRRIESGYTPEPSPAASWAAALLLFTPVPMSLEKAPAAVSYTVSRAFIQLLYLLSSMVAARRCLLFLHGHNDCSFFRENRLLIFFFSPPVIVVRTVRVHACFETSFIARLALGSVCASRMGRVPAPTCGTVKQSLNKQIVLAANCPHIYFYRKRADIPGL